MMTTIQIHQSLAPQHASLGPCLTCPSSFAGHQIANLHAAPPDTTSSEPKPARFQLTAASLHLHRPCIAWRVVPIQVSSTSRSEPGRISSSRAAGGLRAPTPCWIHGWSWSRAPNHPVSQTQQVGRHARTRALALGAFSGFRSTQRPGNGCPPRTPRAERESPAGRSSAAAARRTCAWLDGWRIHCGWWEDGRMGGQQAPTSPPRRVNSELVTVSSAAMPVPCHRTCDDGFASIS
ncbi:hypothetical protein BS78_10G204900 [Paspalum vaginatum]|nr:hypothetical protein BS78_10G204900 [Paspalum vaginatum]